MVACDANRDSVNRQGGSLPYFRILALTIAGFIAIMTETMPAGLLPYISQTLNITPSMAGQMISVYAVGSVVAALPVIALTRGVRRRRLLMTAISGFLVFNLATAFTTEYWLILLERFGAGMAAGMTWGLLTGYTRRMVTTAQQGKALALMGVGQPVALAVGVPAAALYGSYLPWQGMFVIISVVAALLLIWILALLPDFAGETRGNRRTISSILLLPGVLPILLVVLVWILAHNVLYTYISSYLNAHELGDSLDVALLVFGVAAIIGIWATGVFVDSHLRLSALVSLVSFCIAGLVLFLVNDSLTVTLAATGIWGLSFGGAPTILQTALADCAGDSVDIAQSAFVTVFNSAVSGGAILGGGILACVDGGYIPLSATVLAASGLLVVASASQHAFRPGPRES